MMMPDAVLAAQDSDRRVSLHPFTDARAFEQSGPIVMTKGQGIHVWDSEGRQYIEGLSGLWSAAVGFGEERLMRAAADQMAQLPYYHVFAGKAHPASIALSEKLIEMAPAGLERVFYTNSGSEANDTVIKMLWYRNNVLGQGRKKTFLARKRGYHGIGIGSGSLTGLSANHTDFDLPAIPVRHLTCPHFFSEGLPGETEAEFCARLLSELQAVIDAEGAETIAAFIGEPLMGAGGVLPPPPGYWQGVERICRQNDIVIVADEVINGFGRLGEDFGCQKYGFTPDVMVVSKQLSSSYQPIAAILFSDDIYQPLADGSRRHGTFGHGYTGSAHPVAAAVSLENLKIIEERGLVANAADQGRRLLSGLEEFLDFDIVGDVRGAGLIAAVELMSDRESRTPFAAGQKVGQRAFRIGHEEGLIFRAIGDTLALCPPLIVTVADVAEICARMKRVLERLRKELE